MPDTPEDVNPFDAFESAGPLLAFIHHKFGPEGLREVLRAVIDADPPATVEWLEGIASELAALGLKGPAALVTEAAGDAPYREDTNPYPPGSTNARAWPAKLERRQRRRKRSVQ